MPKKWVLIKSNINKCIINNQTYLIGKVNSMNRLEKEHNCKQLMADINSLLDAELDRHSEAKILEELNNCSVCKQYYNTHVAYKTNVSHKIVRVSCSIEIKENILAKIRGL